MPTNATPEEELAALKDRHAEFMCDLLVSAEVLEGWSTVRSSCSPYELYPLGDARPRPILRFDYDELLAFFMKKVPLNRVVVSSI